MSTDLVSGKDSLLGLQITHTWQRKAEKENEKRQSGRETSAMFLLIKTLIISDQGSTLMTSFKFSDFLRGVCPNTAPLWVRFSTYGFWRDTNIHSTTTSSIWFLSHMPGSLLLLPKITVQINYL